MRPPEEVELLTAAEGAGEGRRRAAGAGGSLAAAVQVGVVVVGRVAVAVDGVVAVEVAAVDEGGPGDSRGSSKDGGNLRGYSRANCLVLFLRSVPVRNECRIRFFENLLSSQKGTLWFRKF